MEEKKRIADETEAKRIADETKKREDDERRAKELAEKKRKDPAQAALDLLDTLDKQIAEPGWRPFLTLILITLLCHIVRLHRFV
jgi:hypothetical protein